MRHLHPHETERHMDETTTKTLTTIIIGLAALLTACTPPQPPTTTTPSPAVLHPEGEHHILQQLTTTTTSTTTTTTRLRPATPTVDNWERLAWCESRGNWSMNTGNGYYGGLQFTHQTWLGYHGDEFAYYPHEATKEQQIIVAERLHAKRGWQPWPGCTRSFGWR